MVSSFHGPGPSSGAGDRVLARESVSESESILVGSPGHMGIRKC